MARRAGGERQGQHEREQRQLVLVFPEGRKGTEKLYKDRYKLRRFGRGGFVEAAMRARAPIVPVAVMGAEEAMPIFAHVPLLQRLTGLIYFPINHAFPHFGLLAGGMYLPAKFRIRFLPPIHFEEDGLQRDKSLVQSVAHEVRACSTTQLEEGLQIIHLLHHRVVDNPPQPRRSDK